jgi:ferritin-like metal-binding protein YciE
MPATSLQDLYTIKLQQTYDAERRANDFMPRLVQMANNDDLKTALEAHREQSQEHVRRLERIFQDRGQQAQPLECISMRALIEEGDRLARDVQDPDTLDALIIAAEQSIEHHEIAAYGTARTWARQLGRQDEADVLQRTLREEEGTDQLLSDIAERIVNRRAAERARGAGAEREVTPRAQVGDAGARAGGAAGGGAARERGTAPGGSAEAPPRGA